MEKKATSALVVLSGGQDSLTCLYWALKKFSHVQALSFRYGQRHVVELEQAGAVCAEEKVPHEVASLAELPIWASSALTDTSREVSEQAEGMPSTFVPLRNAVFLTLAGAHAVREGLGALVIGACEVDYSGYPDCREVFLESQEKTLSLAWGKPLTLCRPLVHLSKAEIFALADELGHLEDVLEKSHTCYRGDRTQRHAWGYGCGTCPACVLRAKGYAEYMKSHTQQQGECSHG